MSSYFMTIDPGLNCGASVWREGSKCGENPVWTDCIKVRSVNMKWEDAVFQTGDLLRESLYFRKCSVYYIEEPAFMQSPGGQTVARTSLVKLSILVGIIAQQCWYFGCVRFVPVMRWKGNLPKPVVHKRIREALPKLPLIKDSNTMDAIGLGLWVRGDLR